MTPSDTAPGGAGPPDLPRLTWWQRLIATRWLMLVLGSMLALVLFGAEGAEILEPGSNLVDVAARAWVLRHQSAPLVELARILTNVGSAGATVALGLVASAWLWARERRGVA